MLFVGICVCGNIKNATCPQVALSSERGMGNCAYGRLERESERKEWALARNLAEGIAELGNPGVRAKLR